MIKALQLQTHNTSVLDSTASISLCFESSISFKSWSTSLAVVFARSMTSSCFMQLEIPSSNNSRCSFSRCFAFCPSSPKFRSLSSNSFLSSSLSLPLTCSARALRDVSLVSISVSKSLKKRQFVALWSKYLISNHS